MAQRLKVWLIDTAWMELAFGFMAILWGGGHLVQGQALGHTFGAVQRMFTAQQVEWAFLVVGGVQVATVLYGRREHRGLISVPAFVINCEVVCSIVFSGIFPYGAAALFVGGATASGISVVRNLFKGGA